MQYVGKGSHHNDVGAVQSDCPVPLNLEAYYFEFTVVDGGDRGCIVLGFSDAGFKLSRQPGWEPNSYGYHGDDGRKYHSSGGGEEYAPPYGAGDTVGAGYHLGKQEIFFTKNGKYLGTAFTGVRGHLFPTVGLHSNNEHVELNFGQKPFKFDIDSMLAEEEQQREEAVAQAPLTTEAVRAVVRDYLCNYGYADTLKAFDSATGFVWDKGESKLLGTRKDVRDMVFKGDLEKALARTKLFFDMHGVEPRPRQLRAPPEPPTSSADLAAEALFHLKIQRFIELIRAGNVAEATKVARTELSELEGGSRQHDTYLMDALALLAYEEPEGSDIAYLMSAEQRERVADVVNTAMHVASLPSGETQRRETYLGMGRVGYNWGSYKCTSKLEYALLQLCRVHQGLFDENRQQGKAFQLEEHLL